MSGFNERKDAFEKKFINDQQTQFKIEAHRNKMLGQWAAELLNLTDREVEGYIKEVVKSDFQEAGDEDVFRKIKIDLKNQNISDENIRKKMDELSEKAKSDF